MIMALLHGSKAYIVGPAHILVKLELGNSDKKQISS